jgi:hypothetical protein
VEAAVTKCGHGELPDLCVQASSQGWQNPKDKVPQYLRLHSISHLWTLICKWRDTANEQRKQLKLPPPNPLSYGMVAKDSTAYRLSHQICGTPGIKHHARISGCLSSCAGRL